MPSRQTLDPDSPEAIELRDKAVQSFLERHGFSDVNSPRGIEPRPGHVHMQPMYPIEVAMQLENEAMVNMLIAAGAKRNSQF